MEKKKKFQTGNIVTISVAHLIHDTYSSFLPPLLPLLIEKLSISYSLAGLFTVFFRLPSLLNPLIGMIADKFPVRYFLIISPSLTAIAMSLLGIAPTYGIAVLLLLVAGFSSAMFHTPAPVMVKHISGMRIGKGMSFFMLGGELARSIGPLLVLSAVSIWSLEETYKLIPIGLGASGVLYFKFRNIRLSKDIEKSRDVLNARSTLKKHLKTFGSLTGLIFFIMMLKSALTAFLPTYLTLKGETLLFAGGSLSVLQIAGAAGVFSSGTISDKIGRKNTLLITAISLPALMWLFILLGDFFMFLILLLLGFFLFAATPVMMAIINEIKSERPAFINGIYMTINFLTSAITVTLTGTMGDIFGLDTTYKIVAFFPFLAVPFILTLREEKNKISSKE